MNILNTKCTYGRIDMNTILNANTAERDMTKHTIEIEGLPEGWEAVAFRVPDQSEYYFGRHGLDQATDEWPDRPAAIILQKTKPRRIVLEETDIDAGLDWNDSIHLDDIVINIQSCKNWKIVEDGK